MALRLNLFQQTGRVKELEEIYGQALFGIEAVFGRSSAGYRAIIEHLGALRNDGNHDTNC